ncbi:hypothetical protein OAO19_03350 [Gammaproteobacteria bacterium]|nr:hypothetical protein [Gammaproteobacteria bacterium]MDC3313248.1 hypothetical protein [Gammaproteobacteria bacterium]MDC3368658.1 hypothetical protein [Gammaproteobacteria bacterium]|tara:strand:+ start:225 stop:596 length:372 start_codon:yes stop_codon:yes gene_type:complete
MKIAYTLSGILGVVLAIIALRWILSPEDSANSLGMVLLDGAGRNTQIRDFTALFASTSIFCFLSITTRQYQWIFSSGIVFSLIALISVLASQLHDAPLTYSSLIAEIIFAVMAFTSAFIYKFK